jgi:CRISPR-associated protein Csm2
MKSSASTDWPRASRRLGEYPPFVNMLIAKATYALGRNLVTKDFVEFMKSGVEQVQDAKDMDVFAGFFEAFMGFYKQYDR